MTEDQDHYAVLGVRPGATRDEIRRAWIDLARSHHPDTAGGGPIDRDRAEATIRRINEAWSVLGDDRSRAEYDARRSPTADPIPGSKGGRATADRMPPSYEDTERTEVVAISEGHGLGCLAAVVLLVVLAGIFVLSAYATSSDPSTPATSTTVALDPVVGECVAIVPSSSGLAAVPVSCDGPNSGRVVAIVETPRPCPRGAPRELADRRRTLCVEVS